MAPGLLRRLLLGNPFRQPAPSPFLNALLPPRFPARTELDFHDGRTCVTLLGLHFSNPVRHGLPFPFFRDERRFWTPVP